ncbi:MAG: hypothetical protein M0R46_12480 [Candidatus Muirbacterium halophilum]|nr:hypothetical protein [Candidatus Muirbacterium halophilum]MCK9476733.1 hypothetical protein [Candidatus Muirbacterium halophilum]
MESGTKKEYEEIVKAMLKQSARNIEFRELLLNNPKEALQTIAEREFPENLEVTVLKDTLNGKITQVLLQERKYSRSFYWERYCS